MRLFIAFDLPADWRYELGRRIAAGRKAPPVARWVKPESLHLSLLFLGETDPTQLGNLHRTLTTTFARFPPMSLKPTSIGSFPPRKAARVIWLGVECEDDLAGLQRSIAEDVAEALGRPELVDDRAFRPHITLARCRPTWSQHQVKAFAESFDEEGAIGKPQLCDHGVLFESDLQPTGAVYRALATFALRAS